MRKVFELDDKQLVPVFGVLDIADDGAHLRLMSPAYTDLDGRQIQNKSILVEGEVALVQLRDVLIDAYDIDLRLQAMNSAERQFIREQYKEVEDQLSLQLKKARVHIKKLKQKLKNGGW